MKLQLETVFTLLHSFHPPGPSFSISKLLSERIKIYKFEAVEDVAFSSGDGMEVEVGIVGREVTFWAALKFFLAADNAHIQHHLFHDVMIQVFLTQADGEVIVNILLLSEHALSHDSTTEFVSPAIFQHHCHSISYLKSLK